MLNRKSRDPQNKSSRENYEVDQPPDRQMQIQVRCNLLVVVSLILNLTRRHINRRHIFKNLNRRGSVKNN